MRKDEMKLREEIKVLMGDIQVLNEEKVPMKTKIDYLQKSNTNLMTDYNVA